MKNRRSILTGIFVCALLCAGIPAAATGPAAEAGINDGLHMFFSPLSRFLSTTSTV